MYLDKNGEMVSSSGAAYRHQGDSGWQQYDGGIETFAPESYLIGGAGLVRAGSLGVREFVNNAATGNISNLRFVPQNVVKWALSTEGWALGSMQARSAARGGWSMVSGRGPSYRVQFGAAGGRHGGSYWKLTGSKVHGTHKAPYFFHKTN